MFINNRQHETIYQGFVHVFCSRKYEATNYRQSYYITVTTVTYTSLVPPSPPNTYRPRSFLHLITPSRTLWGSKTRSDVAFIAAYGVRYLLCIYQPTIMVRYESSSRHPLLPKPLLVPIKCVAIKMIRPSQNRVEPRNTGNKKVSTMPQ